MHRSNTVYDAIKLIATGGPIIEKKCSGRPTSWILPKKTNLKKLTSNRTWKVRFVGKKKSPTIVLVRKAIYTRWLSKLFFHPSKSEVINSDICINECLQKRLLPFTEHHPNFYYGPIKPVGWWAKMSNLCPKILKISWFKSKLKLITEAGVFSYFKKMNLYK